MSRPIQVLLVEDNPGDAELTVEILEMSKVRVDIHVAEDGADALSYMFQEPPYESALRPDLILLDLNLPKVSGQEFLASIRKDPNLCSVPVVVLTSSEAEQDIVKSYELGANCYVTKPVGLEAFQTIVQQVEQFWFAVVKLPTEDINSCAG